MNTYDFYSPSLRHTRPWEGRFPYNHDVSVAFFDDAYFVAWNAHKQSHLEGQPGQINLVSRSSDLQVWSEPENIMGEMATTQFYSDESVMWQPNLLNVHDEEIWCFWCITHHKGKSWPMAGSGTYLSRLKKGDGEKWETKPLFERIKHQNKDCLAFPSQNPWICRNGRILVPITLIHSEGGEDGQSFHWNAALYSDDRGETWQLSGVISQVDDSWANWEPHFHEQFDGRVRCFFRNMSRRNLEESMRWQLTCLSGANTIGQRLEFPDEPVFCAMETANSRVHVFPAGSRYCMVHHDVVTNHRTYDSRQNLALFFSRSGADDFVPFHSFSRPGVVSAYPQGCWHDGRIVVAYTVGSNSQRREIELAIIDECDCHKTFLVGPRCREDIHLDISKTSDGLTMGLRTNPDCRTPRVTRMHDCGRDILAFPAASSASVEQDSVPFYSGLGVEFSFCFRVEQWSAEGWLVIATIGDRCAGRLVVAANRPGLLLWVTEESIETISAVQKNCWEPVALYMTPSQTSISVGASEAKPLVHALPRLRVFLGDGYSAGYLGVPSQLGGGSFSVDLTSCRSASIEDDAMLNRAASR